MSANLEHHVIIVGAGPAGSSTAIRLAEAGLSVLLLEQKRFPRQKLCGEFISPECLTHFAELGVLEALRANAVPIERTVFYARDERSVEVPSEWFSVGTHALGLSRAEMDAQLLQRARAAGAEVLENAPIAGLIIEDGRVSGVRLREGSKALAKLVIDATGRARVLAREAEKLSKTTNRRRADYVAFKAHFENVSIPDSECEIYAYRGGYGGCSRIENGRYNLCFIVSSQIARDGNSDAERIMRDVVLSNRRARNALVSARRVSEWLAVPIERYGRRCLAPAEGLLAVGDAAAFIDPFTGSGILLALESAKVLCQALTAAELTATGSFQRIAADYEARYHTTFDRRLRISSVVRRAAFVPFLAETVIRTLSLSSRVTRRLAQATRQPIAHQ